MSAVRNSLEREQTTQANRTSASPFPPSSEPASAPSLRPAAFTSAELALSVLERSGARSSVASTAPSAPSAGQLPPADRGRAAYLVLLATFVAELVIWGVPSSYGVLLEHYLSTEPLRSEPGSASLLALVGTLQTGVMYLSGPLVMRYHARFPEQRRPVLLVGVSISTGSIVISAFVDSARALVATQGALYGIGGAMVYYTSQTFITEWFIARRGLSTGVCFAGTAVGGLVLPFVLTALLEATSTRNTLLIIGPACGAIIVGISPLLKPRGPRLSGPRAGRRDQRSAGTPVLQLLRRRSFLMYVLANTMQASAFFIPALYLPTFATALRLEQSKATATVVAINGASVVSRLLLGFLSDLTSPHMLGGGTLILAGASSFLLWGLAGTEFGPLLAFSLVYGLVAGGWTSLWSAVIRETSPPSSDADLSDANTLFGYLSLSRGLGNVLAAPISSALISGRHVSDRLGYGVADGAYSSTIIYVGALMACAGCLEIANGLAGSRSKA